MARGQSWTVGSLALTSGLDLDQVLIALWTAGIDYPLDPSSRIKAEDSSLAEKTIGLVGARQKRVSYWLETLGISGEQLRSMLLEHGARLSPDARVLPKGFIKKLRTIQRELYPMTEYEAKAEELPSASPFEWDPPGNIRSCTYLVAEEVLQIHEALTADFAATDDPIAPSGVKSIELLESAIGRPATSYGDLLKYPTAESAAAALLHSLVLNHPFYNGNKRTALVSMLVFLDRHNILLTCPQDELFKFMIQVAAHDLLPTGFAYDRKADREVAAISSWIAKRTRPLRREERAVTWRELSKRLRSLGCSIRPDKGEWVVIERRVRIRRSFLLDRHRTLESRFLNTSDGRQVPRSVLKKIRRELELDPEHGYDAEVFYGGAKDPDFFILEYSQLLKRLARV